MPPEATEENVSDCPASRFVAEDGAIVADSAEFTEISPELTVFTEAGVVAESVMRTFALKVLPCMNVFAVNASEFVEPSWFAISVFVMLLKTRKL